MPYGHEKEIYHPYFHSARIFVGNFVSALQYLHCSFFQLLEEFDFSDFARQGFMLKDAKYSKVGTDEIISCLLMHVDQNSGATTDDGGDRILLPEFDSRSFVTVVDWIHVSRHSPEGTWDVVRRRRFAGRHALLLAAIDKVDGEEDALVLASEGAEFRMIFDSEGDVKALSGVEETSKHCSSLYFDCRLKTCGFFKVWRKYTSKMTFI
jgi:hypothetical protein